MFVYVSAAASVGNGTHGEPTSSRIDTAWYARNLSADLPFSCRPGTWSTARYCLHASYVLSPTSTVNADATLQKRAAVLTVSPSAVYWSRSRLPMLPTTAGPVLMPMPQLMGGNPFAARCRCTTDAWLMRS